MTGETARLPSLERVRFIGGLHPLMEIADPHPELYFDKFTKVQLAQTIQVGINYQIKLIEAERLVLDARAAALADYKNIFKGFK
jgi:hypothetical protein